MSFGDSQTEGRSWSVVWWYGSRHSCMAREQQINSLVICLTKVYFTVGVQPRRASPQQINNHICQKMFILRVLSTSEYVTCLRWQMESQAITKIDMIDPLGNMNICAEFDGNPLRCGWDFPVWTEGMDWPTNSAAPWSHTHKHACTHTHTHTHTGQKKRKASCIKIKMTQSIHSRKIPQHKHFWISKLSEQACNGWIDKSVVSAGPDGQRWNRRSTFFFF